MKTILALFGCLLFATPCFSAEKASKDLAKLSPLAYAAFECHHFALMAKDQKLAEKLFNLGYRSGLEFLEAVKAKKIKEEDLRAEVPIGFKWVAEGPSNDFIMGRLYESSSRDSEKVRSEQPGADADTWVMLARNELITRNAELLVRDEPDEEIAKP